MRTNQRLSICRIPLNALALAIVLLVSVPTHGLTVERFSVDFNRADRFLPYRVVISDSGGPAPCTHPIRHPRQLCGLAPNESNVVLVLAADNMSSQYDRPATVALLKYPGAHMFWEAPLWLTVTDVGVLEPIDTLGSRIWVAGFSRDTAWILIITTTTRQCDTLVLAAGTDVTGDGAWQGSVELVASFDYDHDSTIEHLFYVNPERDVVPRLLVCIELGNQRIEWTLPVASPIQAGFVVPCGDLTDPGILFSTGAPGQNARDSTFRSDRSYLVRVDRYGNIVFKRLIGYYPYGTGLVQQPDKLACYLSHRLAIGDTVVPERDTLPQFQITKLDRDGFPIGSTTISGQAQGMWLSDFDGDSALEVHTISERVIRVLDDDLRLIAESDSVGLQYVGEMADWAGHGPVQCFREGAQIGVYTPRFEKLAVTPFFEYSNCLRKDNAGHTQSFLAASLGSHFIGEIRKQSYLDLVAMLYVDNQRWVLTALVALLIGLFTANFYRGRLARQKRELEAAHYELAETHEALKKAQQAIIAHEKYRQAKDIAGGFAHEIRNALFPADSALTKLRAIGELSLANTGKVQSLHSSVRDAVARAIEITQQISRYTKLESEYRREPVNLMRIIDEVREANQIRISELGLTVTATSDPSVTVEASARQLYSVFNNLLLNSLDALTKGTDATIIVQWARVQEFVLVSFEDNGPGIPEADRGRIFDAFYSTKPSTGTGLGLAVAKRIVELYDGSIAAVAPSGSGARFEIRLRQPSTGT